MKIVVVCGVACFDGRYFDRNVDAVVISVYIFVDCECEIERVRMVRLSIGVFVTGVVCCNAVVLYLLSLLSLLSL